MQPAFLLLLRTNVIRWYHQQVLHQVGLQLMNVMQWRRSYSQAADTLPLLAIALWAPTDKEAGLSWYSIISGGRSEQLMGVTNWMWKLSVEHSHDGG